MKTPIKPTVSLTIAQELLDKVDKEADKLYISRSAWIVTAIAQKLQSEEILRALPEFTDTIRLALKNEQAKNKNSKSDKRDTEIPYMDATREGAEKLDFFKGLDEDIARAKK